PQRELGRRTAPDVAADRADLHVEGAGAPGQTLADPPIAEDAERPPGQLGPRGWSRRADGPLALPGSAAEGGVQPSERAREREHRTDHVLGDAGLVAVDVREERPRGERRAVDPIEAGPGHLDEPQPFGRLPHITGEDR